MPMIQQVAFLIILGVAGFIIRRRILTIRNNIRLGKPNSIRDRTSARLSNVLLVAFGQQKMFKRLIPAILHFFIYAGFIISNALKGNPVQGWSSLIVVVLLLGGIQMLMMAP